MTIWDVLSDKMEKLEVEGKTNKKNWNDLPFEMKELVVKEMDFKTRARLKMCSKSDKYLVESVPISYDRLSFLIGEYTRSLGVSLNISHKSKTILLVSMQLHKNQLNFLSTYMQIPCLNIEEGDEIVKQILASILLTGKLRFDSVYVDHKSLRFSIHSEFTIHAKHVRIAAERIQIFEWLNVMAPGVESVDLHSQTWFPSEDEGIDTSPAIMNASKVLIKGSTHINDEQLLNFKCTFLTIVKGNTKITGKGCNQLIKKLIANDYPTGTCISFNYFWFENRMDWNTLLEGLNVEVTACNDFINGFNMIRHCRDGQIVMSHNKLLKIKFGVELLCIEIVSQ